MELTIYIPDESVELLEGEPESVAQRLMDKELLRLWHVRRSQPKPRDPKRPVGRPPVDHHWRELVEEGERVFQTLRRHAGGEFERVYGVHEAQFKALVETGNSIALEDFLNRRAWGVGR